MEPGEPTIGLRPFGRIGLDPEQKRRGGAQFAISRFMSKPIPTIQKYMTTAPHSIGVDQTLAQAHIFLKKHEIRHLPVLSGGALVGMLTDRDLSLIETLQGV